MIRAGANLNAPTISAPPLWIAGLTSARHSGLLGAGGIQPSCSSRTPLLIASRSGNPLVITQLIARCERHTAFSARQTALCGGVTAHPYVVKVLLARGADIRARSDTWSQMMAVPPHGKLEYNRLIPHGGDTALMFAARVGDLPSATLLLAAGANVNDADAWGVSATTLAAHSGFIEIVELLLDKGADPNAAARFTALHEAIMRATKDRDVFARTARIRTPLQTWTPEPARPRTQFCAGARRRTPFGSRRASADLRDASPREPGADPLFVHRTRLLN